MSVTFAWDGGHPSTSVPEAREVDYFFNDSLGTLGLDASTELLALLRESARDDLGSWQEHALFIEGDTIIVVSGISGTESPFPRQRFQEILIAWIAHWEAQLDPSHHTWSVRERPSG